MPTTTERYASGIYIAYWIGDVKLADVFDARDAIYSYAQEDNRDRYIVIIDGTETSRVPTDLRILMKTSNSGTIAILVYKAPLAGKIVGQMFNSIMPFKAEFYEDFDEILQRAHTLLAAEGATNNAPED